nr:kinesin-like protein KIN-12B [Tanacetum cinerariifolium]
MGCGSDDDVDDELYADLEEKHINLLTSQRRIEDGILDVKKAAAKAGVKTGELLVRLKEAEEVVAVAEPIGFKGIANVDISCVLGCEEFLDSSSCGEEGEQ